MNLHESWLASMPGGPTADKELVFTEPWQAQAFAMTFNLAQAGRFTWSEWTSALADELKAAAERGDPDDGSWYYQHWVAALEKLLVAKSLLDPAVLIQCKHDWADAYRHTPHGEPVMLTVTKHS